MEKKYISSSRYKKTIKSKRNKRRVQSVSYKLAHIDSMSVSGENYEDNVKSKKKNKGVKLHVPKISLKTALVISLCLVICILVITRIILKKDEGFWDFLMADDKNLKSEYSICVNTQNSSLDSNYTNLAIVEMENIVNDTFIQINEDYSITYKALEKIEKLSNSKYRLYIKNEYKDKISSEAIKATLESYKNVESVYYNNVSNIKEIKIVDESSLEITLSKDDPLYIYNLNIPVKPLGKNETSSNSVVYSKNNVKLNFAFETDIDSIVQQFKAGTIDMFMTGDKMAVSQIGNYSYDMYSYRTGETVFLFGNKDSDFFKDKVMRQAIAYSINRDKIVQDVYMGSGETIDLPYIYSNSKYKYDIYSAQNLLLDNGYVLNDGYMCKKTEDNSSIPVILKLLVNKQDTKKVQIAECIKRDLENQRNKSGIGF